MGTARILLAGGGKNTLSALQRAFDQSTHKIDIVHITDADDALMALVAERFQLCILRAHDDAPHIAQSFCADAKEAGVRVPIIVLMDIASTDNENALLSAGALAAMPWDGSQDAMLRNIVNLTLGLRKTEDNLRQSNDRLVTEMRTLQDERERAESLNFEYVDLVENYAAAKSELEKLNQEKNKFFSIIAHDLRSPFTALLGFSSLLEQRAETMPPDKIKEFAVFINDAGNRVFKLLENLLEWSRLQMDRVNIQPHLFLVGDVARKTVEVLGPVAQEKNITLNERGNPPEVYADPNMIDAVIRNLVNNAIKFTPTGGTITVLYGIDADANTARISVIDNGVGMSEQVASKLFNIAENSSTQGTAGEDGTGLGLLLCKELVERNHGHLEVESTSDVGSTFSFTLPLKAPAA